MSLHMKLTTPSIIFTSPKFNYGHCKYLADKLKLTVESAQYLSTTEALESLILTTVDGAYQAEVKIVEVKASDDRETLLRVVNGLRRTRTSTDSVSVGGAST